MTTIGTTTYLPANAGGHVYHRAEDVPNSDCTVCGGHPWDAVHTLVEEHGDIALEELRSAQAVYAVEASDDGARSYVANGLRWTEVEAARRWASGLAMRWFGCTHIRVVRVSPPIGGESLSEYVVLEVVTQTL